MNQEKLNTIKEYKEIDVKGKLPVALDNLDKAQFALHEAKTTKDTSKLVVPTIYMVEAENALTVAKKELNKAIKEKQAEAKSIDQAIQKLKADIKEATLELAVETKTVAKDRSGNIKVNENGEPEYNVSNNLNSTMFSYTAPIKKTVIDKVALLEWAKANKKTGVSKKILVTETIYSLDQQAIQQLQLEGIFKFPLKNVDKPASVSIKGKDILKNAEKLLEVKEEEKND